MAQSPRLPEKRDSVQLGQLYNYGNGVERDYEKAFELFNRAVGIWQEADSQDAFFPAALDMIAEMYLLGHGVEKDLDKAAEYYDWAEELEKAN